MTMGRKMLNNFIKIIKLNDENKLLNAIFSKRMHPNLIAIELGTKNNTTRTKNDIYILYIYTIYTKTKRV